MNKKAYLTAIVLIAALSSAIFAEGQRFWGSATLISQPDFAHRSFLLMPQAAMLESGDALTVWAQSRVPGTPLQFTQFARRFSPASGWENIQQLGPANPGPLEPIARNDSGRAALPYTESGPVRALVRDYSPQSGWNLTPARLDDSQHAGVNVQVAIDDAGNMLAIWNAFQQESGAKIHRIYARRFQNAGGWGPIELIVEEPFAGLDSDRPGLAMNAQGEAIVVWRSQVPEASHNTLFGRFFRPASGWSDIEAVSEKTRMVSAARHPLTMDRDGNVQVLYDDATTDRLYFRRYQKQFGWTAELVVDDDPATYATAREMTGNQYGQSLIVRAKPAADDGQISLYYRRFQPEFGTLSPERLLHIVGKGQLDDVRTALSDSGEAHVVFSRISTDSELSIEALEYYPSLDAWLDHSVLYSEQLTGTVNPSRVSLSLSGNRGGAAVAVWGVKNLNAATGRVWASLYR